MARPATCILFLSQSVSASCTERPGNHDDDDDTTKARARARDRLDPLTRHLGELRQRSPTSPPPVPTARARGCVIDINDEGAIIESRMFLSSRTAFVGTSARRGCDISILLVYFDLVVDSLRA